jgi:hypothetical protein
LVPNGVLVGGRGVAQRQGREAPDTALGERTPADEAQDGRKRNRKEPIADESQPAAKTDSKSKVAEAEKVEAANKPKSPGIDFDSDGNVSDRAKADLSAANQPADTPKGGAGDRNLSAGKSERAGKSEGARKVESSLKSQRSTADKGSVTNNAKDRGGKNSGDENVLGDKNVPTAVGGQPLGRTIQPGDRQQSAAKAAGGDFDQLKQMAAAPPGQRRVIFVFNVQPREAAASAAEAAATTELAPAEPAKP